MGAFLVRSVATRVRGSKQGWLPAPAAGCDAVSPSGRGLRLIWSCSIWARRSAGCVAVGAHAAKRCGSVHKIKNKYGSLSTKTPSNSKSRVTFLNVCVFSVIVGARGTESVNEVEYVSTY